MRNFSILNPKGTKDAQINRSLYANIFSGLGLPRVLRIETIYAGGKMTTGNLADFITGDAETILHRLDIFEDLLTGAGLIELLRDTILPGVQSLLP